MALQFGNIHAFSYKTPIYFLRGSLVTFTVTDSQNETSNSAYFTMVSGDTAACEVKFYPGVPILAPGETDEPNLKIDPPDVETDACNDYFFVDWGITGTPPYVFSAQTTGLSILQSTVFANLTSGLPNLQVAFPSGVEVVFGVQDSVGRQSFTTPITIQPYVIATNSCVISNLTKPDSSIPSPTTRLPFPSFYPLSTSTSSNPFSTSRTTFASSPTISAKLSGPDASPEAVGPDIGTIIGLAFGIPLGIIFLASLLAAFLAAHRQQQRRNMVQAYWNARAVTDGHVLAPRGERYAPTPFSG